MSFPRYPKYKPSGVEWLGDVPEHWTATKLKHLGQAQIGLTYDPTDIVDASEGTLVLRSSNVQNGRIVFDDNVFVQMPIPPRLVTRLGDILICSRNGSRALIGKNAMIGSDASGLTFGAFMTVFRSDLNPFLFWVFNSQIFELQSASFLTSTINQLTIGNLNSFDVLLPPQAEQTQIASFLDRETAKIDGLVGEQRRLIELLKEKRQAVISHAVTKGLNPHAPLKPSGIEWLGDVPEHWEVLPLKRIVAVPITDGPHETPQFFDEGVPFVSAEAVSSGRIDFSRVRACISKEDNARYSQKYSPKPHDIYMVKSGATTGVTAIVEDRTDFNIWSPLAVIRCGGEAVPHFVLNFMRSRNFLEAVSLNWSFGTQQNIGMGVIENLACTVPPVEEQSEVAQFLKHETAKLDALTAEAERAIELLQERRTALISAAVTGKIDVRRLAATEDA